MFNFNLRPPLGNKYAPTTSIVQDPKKMLYLFNPSYNFNVFRHISRLFIIKSKDKSYKFNINFIKDTSSLIQDQLTKDPRNLQYNLITKDGEKIIGRIQLLFSGEKVKFFKSEEDLFFQVIEELKIRDSIRLRKRNLSAPPRVNDKYEGISFTGHRLSNDDFELEINKKKFEKYLAETMAKNFTIVTKNKEYECNIIGANSSKVIHEFTKKNPNKNRYEYDFDDNCNEFELICHFFNFQKVEITIDNMISLKNIAEDLQIDILMADIDDFIDDYEKRVQIVDDQQTIIDSISELFEKLENIKELKVDSVKDFILDSCWCKTEENVQELVAFILQVNENNFLLIPYLADLIELLNKEANKSNKLEILVPFLVNKLMNSFESSKYNNFLVFALLKKGFIQKADILKKLRHCNPFYESYLVFLPEIAEINDFKLILIKIPSQFREFSKSYFEDDFENFKKMRDKNEPDDQITVALINDDVDTLQSIISMSNTDINAKVIPVNIFDHFQNLSYINYSAAHGSIRCFKYLLLNHANLNSSSFKLAVFGGNVEIIKIVEQNESDLIDIEKSKQAFNLIDMILPTIEKHQNDLFDWIFDQKYTNAIQNKQLISNILLSASKNGDIHSITAIIDRGYNFANSDFELCRGMINNASNNGFFKLLEFISIIIHKKVRSLIFNWKLSVNFGNLSIFKFFFKKLKSDEIYKALVYATEKEYKSIIEYIFDNLNISSNAFNNSDILEILSKSIPHKTNDIFVYLVEKFKKIDSSIFSQSSHLIDLLAYACNIQNIEIAKIITDLMLSVQKNPDFSLAFFNAAAVGSTELCKYFIDKKVFINFNLISYQIEYFVTVNKDIFDIIVENASESTKDMLVCCCLDYAISAKNKVLIEYLLNKNAFSDNALNKAIKTKDTEIVNMILDHYSELSFINQVTKDGSALNLAAIFNEITIVKRLLSIPGINPNLYDNIDGSTPLISAIYESNIEIAKMLIEFESVNINHRNFYKDTALIVSVKNNLIEIVDLIINNKKFDPKESRLDFAFISSNNDEISKKLAKVKGFDINCKIIEHNLKQNKYNDPNKYDNFTLNFRYSIDEDLCLTPLTYAVLNKKTNLIDVIIDHPQFDPVKSNIKKAIFDSCTKDITVFRKLIKKIDNDVNIKNESGKSLIDVAVKNNNLLFVKEILNNEKFDSKKCDFFDIFIYSFINSFDLKVDILNAMVDYDSKHEKLIDFKKCLPSGKSFFTAFSKYTNKIKSIITFLLDVGVDPNAPDKFGVYPLQHAIEIPNLSFVECLVDSGKIDFSAKIEVKNTFKFGLNKKLKDQNKAKYKTYLHLAVNAEDQKIFNLFIDKKLMDINVTDSNGETPLMDALRANKTNIINRLFEEDNLDYLHCNDKGEDALTIAHKLSPNWKIDPPKSKEEYQDTLLLMLSASFKIKELSSGYSSANSDSDDIFSNSNEDKSSQKIDNKQTNASSLFNSDKKSGTGLESSINSILNAKPLEFSFNFGKVNDNKPQSTLIKSDADKNKPILSLSNNSDKKSDTDFESSINSILNEKSFASSFKFNFPKVNDNKPQSTLIKSDADKNKPILPLSNNSDKKSDTDLESSTNSNLNAKPLEFSFKFNQSSENKQQSSSKEPDSNINEQNQSFSFNEKKENKPQPISLKFDPDKIKQNPSFKFSFNLKNEKKSQPTSIKFDADKSKQNQSFSTDSDEKGETNHESTSPNSDLNEKTPSFSFRFNQDDDKKQQKSSKEPDTNKNEQIPSFSNNSDKNNDASLESPSPNSDLNAKSPSFSFKFSQDCDKKQQSSSKEPDTNKKEQIPSFSNNSDKNNDASLESPSPNSDLNEKTPPFSFKSNQKCENKPQLTAHKPSHTEEESINDSHNEDSQLQKEIVSSILGTLDNFTPDEAQRISRSLSSIVMKEAEKMSTHKKEQEEDFSKKNEEVEQQSQFGSGEKTTNKGIQCEKKVMETKNSKPKSWLQKIRRIDNEDGFYDYDNQNQFNYDFDASNQAMMQQWNQMMMINNMRNSQFNMIMQQQEQMMTSIKHKSKKTKKKNHK